MAINPVIKANQPKIIRSLIHFQDFPDRIVGSASLVDIATDFLSVIAKKKSDLCGLVMSDKDGSIYHHQSTS